MKKIILAIILISAVELGLTYYVSFETEKAYNKTIQLINSSPNMSAKLISYQRGLFRAEALTEIKQGQDTYVLKDHILHGPIVFDTTNPFIKFCIGLVHSQISPSPLNTPIEAELAFSYFGGATIKTSSQSFVYQDKDTILEGSGWKGRGKINAKFDTYQFENSVPEMIIHNKSTPNSGTQIKNAKIAIEYHQGNKEDQFKITYIIDDARTLDQFAILTNLHLTGNFTSNQETFDSNIQFNFDKINLQARALGPASISFKIENIDKKILELIARKATLQPSDQLDTDAIYTKALQRVISLTINELEINLPEGKLSLQSQAKIGSEMLTPPLTADKILQTLKGKVTLSLPKELFNSFIDGYVKASLEKDPNYKNLLDAEKMTKFTEEKDHLIDSLKKSEILSETDDLSIIKFSNTTVE